MASLFEAFVRNFYKKEQSALKVRREAIYWDLTPIDDSNISYLPEMHTDITLESPDRKIIIDTKYYTNTLSKNYDSLKFHSENMYQLYSYLKNNELNPKHPKNSCAEGILLYPSVEYNLRESFQMGSHKLTICTVDLNSDWKIISKSLKELISK